MPLDSGARGKVSSDTSAPLTGFIVIDYICAARAADQTWFMPALDI